MDAKGDRGEIKLDYVREEDETNGPADETNKHELEVEDDSKTKKVNRRNRKTT